MKISWEESRLQVYKNFSWQLNASLEDGICCVESEYTQVGRIFQYRESITGRLNEIYAQNFTYIDDSEPKKKNLEEFYATFVHPDFKTKITYSLDKKDRLVERREFNDGQNDCLWKRIFTVQKENNAWKLTALKEKKITLVSLC